MKYCLSCRQPKKVLNQIDQIKIQQRDFKAIPDYIDNYPEKDLILELNNILPENFNWNIIKTYSKKCQNHFYCAVSNYNQILDCKNNGINFYYKYPINSFYELNALKEIGVSYILLAPPLFFDLDNVKKFGIPIRAIPNLAYEPYLKHQDGMCGSWIRPEDVKIYEKYIEVFDFFAPEGTEKEETLYNIYKKQEWIGNLNLLIENLDIDCDNSCFYKDFGKTRLNCKQRCQFTNNCHYCPTQFLFSIKTAQYKDEN